MIHLKRVNIVSELQKDELFERYTQDITCHFEQDGEIVIMKGEFICFGSGGKISGNANFHYEESTSHVS